MAASLQYQSVYVGSRIQAVSIKWHVISGLTLLAALVIRVSVKLENTSVGYELAKERRRTIDLDMQRRELGLQLSVLTRPDALAKRAKEKLGLRDLGAVQSVTLSE